MKTKATILAAGLLLAGYSLSAHELDNLPDSACYPKELDPNKHYVLKHVGLGWINPWTRVDTWGVQPIYTDPLSGLSVYTSHGGGHVHFQYSFDGGETWTDLHIRDYCDYSHSNQSFQVRHRVIPVLNRSAIFRWRLDRGKSPTGETQPNPDPID